MSCWHSINPVATGLVPTACAAKLQRQILCQSLFHADDCIEEGEEFTGNLSFAYTGDSCITWYRLHLIDPGLFSLTYFPDSSWDDLSNHCRYVFTIGKGMLGLTGAEKRLSQCVNSIKYFFTIARIELY